MRFVVVPLFVMMCHEGEVDGEQQAEDESLHNTGEELDGEEEVPDGQEEGISVVTQFIHGNDGFSAAKDVAVETQAQGYVLHRFGNDFDEEDHWGDKDGHCDGQFWSRKVGEVSDNAIGSHSFVLDVADSDESHSEVEGDVGCG